MYFLEDFIRKYDTNNEVIQSIINCLTENMTKEVAIDILAKDLKNRLYEYIYNKEELEIDDGSNVARDFTDTIKEILKEYFHHVDTN